VEYPVQRLQENCPAIKQKSVYWKKKKMSAVERQKPIVELCTQDMMQKRVH